MQTQGQNRQEISEGTLRIGFIGGATSFREISGLGSFGRSSGVRRSGDGLLDLVNGTQDLMGFGKGSVIGRRVGDSPGAGFPLWPHQIRITICCNFGKNSNFLFGQVLRSTCLLTSWT